MQAELSRVKEAYVADSLEFREIKSALTARLKVLEAELLLAKNLCKQQDYDLQQSAGTGGAATAVVADNIALENENTALRKRVREFEANEEGTEALKKRVKELEKIEAGWLHLSGVFASAR